MTQSVNDHDTCLRRMRRIHEEIAKHQKTLKQPMIQAGVRQTRLTSKRKPIHDTTHLQLNTAKNDTMYMTVNSETFQYLQDLHETPKCNARSTTTGSRSES